MADAAPGPRSLGTLLRGACERHPARTAMLVPGQPQFKEITYGELFERVFQAAASLQQMGLARGDRLAIIGETSPEWAICDWAAQTLGLVVVPIFPTLPADQTQFILGDSGARAAICSSDQQAAKAEGLRTALLGQLASGAQMDRQAWLAGIDEIQTGDLATIIYTSGTTGRPRGAMLPHRCFLFLTSAIQQSIPVNEDDVFLSHLPLAHVYERFAGHVLPVSLGAAIAYSEGLTKLAANMLQVRPTIILTIPRLLEAMRSRISEAAQRGPWLGRALFNMAIAQGRTSLDGRPAPLHWLTSRIVGRRVRERMGGRLRFFVSGGAPLSPAVSAFYASFGITVLQGYGLTETMAATCVNHPDSNRPETVGPPIPGVELHIAADGEIFVRGPSVMDGYYNLPEDTAAAIDDKGWFHTGDIGVLDAGCLKITDRKKDIIVLSNGKNVAPQAIEGRLKDTSTIAEAVAFGDGSDFVYALVVPDFEVLRHRARELGLTDTGEAALASAPPLLAELDADVQRVNAQLADFERIKRYEVVPEPFSIEGGQLTPSMKVRRKVVREMYPELIARAARVR